jgi:hypothetical protein
VKQLIALRKQNPALRRGDFKRLWSVDGTYVFSRSLDGNTFVIALNVSDSLREARVTFDKGEIPQVVFGEASELRTDDGRLQFKIPARCGVVLK